ncbi:unnamed protein product [Penicillium camemberti]|uniref:Str. FM013 n=1 Tax=Penicillium camemberti (strain FM 013) TaxID=1429867 RepID=A0A0G4PLK6_PENC3|nr:unnamed protein product [Penicillium camemberti]
MEAEEKNTFRCVDKDRHIKLHPLLDLLGYRQIKVKISGPGKAEINPAPNYRSLFFPLTIDSEKEELQVAGEVLTPGDYIPITSSLILDARLDCLIVLLPETSKQ